MTPSPPLDMPAGESAGPACSRTRLGHAPLLQNFDAATKQVAELEAAVLACEAEARAVTVPAAELKELESRIRVVLEANRKIFARFAVAEKIFLTDQALAEAASKDPEVALLKSQAESVEQRVERETQLAHDENGRLLAELRAVECLVHNTVGARHIGEVSGQAAPEGAAPVEQAGLAGQG